MHKKALTVAIAAALAAPMAAQAQSTDDSAAPMEEAPMVEAPMVEEAPMAESFSVDIGGQVSRALVLLDSKAAANSATVKNWGGASTRLNFNGKLETMDGNSFQTQLEYEESGTTVSLRHANVQYGGDFGKITLGKGSEAGDGSAYPQIGTGVHGLGHGAGYGSSAQAGGKYHASLDAGGREEMVKYETPSFGPISVAVSLADKGGKDRLSAQLGYNEPDLGGMGFAAKLATLREEGESETLGASFGVSMESGLIVSGAWAKAKKHGGAAAGKDVLKNIGCVDSTGAAVDPVPSATLDGVYTCGATNIVAVEVTKGTPVRMATDPSYVQLEVGYKIGDTTVAASWYNSSDLVMKGSDGTAIGVGATHTVGKTGATVFVAAQRYEVDLPGAMKDPGDVTAIAIGTVIAF